MESTNLSPKRNRCTDDKFIMIPTVDVCFKNLMHNAKVRKGFLAALLKVDPETITETTLLPTILRQDYPDDKLGVLDVRVLLKDGRQFDIEMQVAYFEYWDARILFYLSKIFTDQLKRGEPYENLKKCIHVSILDFIYFENDEDKWTEEKHKNFLEGFASNRLGNPEKYPFYGAKENHWTDKFNIGNPKKDKGHWVTLDNGKHLFIKD